MQAQKLHLPLLHAVGRALYLIFEENKYADKVIESVLKSDRRWGARDRAFIAENTYEIVRYKRLLCSLVPWQEPAKEQDYTQLIGVLFTIRGIDFDKTEAFGSIDKAEILKKYKHNEPIRKIIESIPDWLDELGEERFGAKRWGGLISSLNKQAPLVIRANTLKISRDKLIYLLKEQHIEVMAGNLADEAIVLKNKQNIFNLDLFKSGSFEVQDEGSQCIAEFVDVAAGMRVIDACAGAGGKSLHLAALMKNKGTIISMDTEAWKLAELKKRASRAGVDIIQTKEIENSKTIKRLEASCDRLLLDVPCSGLGVLRRNPDAKWKLNGAFLQKVRNTQAEIIHNYSKMLKTKGIMVYATCSILPDENEMQVRAFLEKNTAFSLVKEQTLYPDVHGTDGFYMAQLIKN